MLSEDNIRRINRQIENHLRDLQLCPRDEEAEIIESIAAMKALLTEQPRTEEIVAETIRQLATASKSQIRVEEPTIGDVLRTIFASK